jgi:SAM-dependent methyltransferase
MWQDYEATYQNALQDSEFLAWRELGAHRKAQNIANVCRGIEVGSVLEIGCGTGAVLRMLRAMKFAREYFCIDLSSSAVRFTRDSCPAFAFRAVVGGADALPFRDNAFSVSILSHVIEHLDDPVSALHEASRIARFTVVEVPTERVLSNFVRRKMLRCPYPSVAGAGHLQFWSPSSIATFLQRDAGLDILNRYLDVLSQDVDSGRRNGRGPRSLAKQTLRNALPGSVYSRLLTTHAVFLCRRSAAGDALGSSVSRSSS